MAWSPELRVLGGPLLSPKGDRAMEVDCHLRSGPQKSCWEPGPCLALREKGRLSSRTRQEATHGKVRRFGLATGSQGVRTNVDPGPTTPEPVVPRHTRCLWETLGLDVTAVLSGPNLNSKQFSVDDPSLSPCHQWVKITTP